MCCQNTFESASLSESYWQGKQTIPYLLMTTLKITFYKNIKSVLVLVNHHFLILGGKKVEIMSGQKKNSQQIIIFFPQRH